MNEFGILFMVFLPILLIGVNIASFIIILLHELGHAIPAILFSKENATIYIGSYGDDSGFKVRIGKLSIVIRPKLFYLRAGGLCKYAPIESTYQNAFVIIAGPLSTVIVASLLFPIMLENDIHGSLKLMVVILLVCSILTLFNSFYPRKIIEEKVYMTDGLQLINLFKLKSGNKNLFVACKLFSEKDYTNTLKKLDKIDKQYLNEQIINIYLWSHINLCQYKAIEELYVTHKHTNLFDCLGSEDYINLSFAYIQLKNYGEALHFLNKAVYIDPDNYYSLNNRGFVLNLLGDYSAARTDLDKACEMDSNAAYALTNRAYANVKLGMLDEAKADIKKSMALNEDNPYVYLVTGMYQLEIGDLDAALINLAKAKQMDEFTVMVDDYIRIANHKLMLKINK